jgi:hypothetical protein
LLWPFSQCCDVAIGAGRQTAQVHVAEGAGLGEDRRESRIGKARLPDDAPADLLGGGRALRGRVLGNAGGFLEKLVVLQAIDAEAFKARECVVALRVEVEAVDLAELRDVDKESAKR